MWADDDLKRSVVELELDHLTLGREMLTRPHEDGLQGHSDRTKAALVHMGRNGPQLRAPETELFNRWSFLAVPSRNGREISITGKWVPTKKGGLFRKSAESTEMLREWDDIHADAGVLSTEINHGVGDESVLVHHVFADSDALVMGH